MDFGRRHEALYASACLGQHCPWAGLFVQSGRAALFTDAVLRTSTMGRTVTFRVNFQCQRDTESAECDHAIDMDTETPSPTVLIACYQAF